MGTGWDSSPIETIPGYTHYDAQEEEAEGPDVEPSRDGQNRTSGGRKALVLVWTGDLESRFYSLECLDQSLD